MESSNNISDTPMHRRQEKDKEMLRQIDLALSEETTLLDGLKWAVDHDMLTPEEADQAMMAFWKGPETPAPEAA